jgi:hypothetical protein
VTMLQPCYRPLTVFSCQYLQATPTGFEPVNLLHLVSHHAFNYPELRHSMRPRLRLCIKHCSKPCYTDLADLPVGDA